MPSRSRKLLRLSIRVIALLVLFVVASGAGTLTWFHYGPPAQTCGSCHEMHTHINEWKASAHHGIHCRNCHGGTLTGDIHALRQDVRRLVGHFGKAQPEEVHLDHEQLLAVGQACEKCHAEVYGRWKSGGHAATFAAIFLDPKQNHRERLNGDCLRCHGMFFQGTTDTLVTPIDTAGPWKLRDPALEQQPAIPCLACHQMHTPRPPVPADATAHATSAVFYSRHEKAYFAAADLPMAAIEQDGHSLRVAPDPRQRFCVQCHAPNALHNAGVEDDRTPTGVHEGLSCLDCHDAHATEPLKATCEKCHAGKTIKSPGKKVHGKG